MLRAAFAHGSLSAVVRVNAGPKGVTLTGYDGGAYVTASVRVISATGAFEQVVTASALRAAFNRIDKKTNADANILLHAMDDGLELESGTEKASIGFAVSVPFEKMPRVTGGQEIRSEELAKALRLVMAAAPRIDASDRPYSDYGILIDGDLVVATDGYRMHRARLASEKLPRFCMDSTAAAWVLVSMDRIQAQIDEEYATFRDGDVEVLMPLRHPAGFPKHGDVVPDSDQCSFRLPLDEKVRREWLQKMETLPVPPKSRAISVRLNGAIELYGEDGRGRSADATIAQALATGGEVELYLRRDQLKAALELPVTELCISGETDRDPVVFRGPAVDVTFLPLRA